VRRSGVFGERADASRARTAGRFDLHDVGPELCEHSPGQESALIAEIEHAVR
jgi:hypothetical protein